MKKLLFISLITVVVMVSCSSKAQDIYEINYPKQLITARVGIASRAMVTNGDSFNIDFVRMDTPTATTKYNFATVGTGFRSAATQAGEIAFLEQYYKLNNDFAYFRCFNNLPHTHNPNDQTLTWSLDGKSDLLVSNEWSAGSYTAPQPSGLVFDHLLSRLEIRCQASSAGVLSLVQQLWGEITSITVQTHKNAVYTYSSNSFSYTTPVELPMFQGETESLISLSNPMSILDFNTPGVTASVMLPTNTASSTITLTITTSALGSTPRQVDVEIPSGLAAGRKHVITINFPSTQILSKAATNELTYACSTSEW